MEKERVGVWTKDLHEVEAIKESEGQTFIQNQKQGPLVYQSR